MRRLLLPGYAKADAQVLAVDPALAYPNVSLMTNEYVEKLKTNAAGTQVTSVVVRRRDSLEETAPTS